MLILRIPSLVAIGVAYVVNAWVPRPTVVEQTPARSQAGFTLTDLAVVVGIVVGLAAIVLPNVGRFSGEGESIPTPTVVEQTSPAVVEQTSPAVVEQTSLPSDAPIVDVAAPAMGPAEEKLETGTANSSVEPDPPSTTLQVEVPGVPPLSGPAIVVPSTFLHVGETASVTIELPGLTTGFAGYDILVTLEDITVAEIVDVSFPAFGLTQASQPAPNQLRLRAVNLGGVDSGSDPMEMATLEILGKQDGTSDLSVTVNRLDDLAGDAITVTIHEGRVTVQTASAG